MPRTRSSLRRSTRPCSPASGGGARGPARTGKGGGGRGAPSGGVRARRRYGGCLRSAHPGEGGDRGERPALSLAALRPAAPGLRRGYGDRPGRPSGEPPGAHCRRLQAALGRGNRGLSRRRRMAEQGRRLRDPGAGGGLRPLRGRLIFQRGGAAAARDLPDAGGPRLAAPAAPAPCDRGRWATSYSSARAPMACRRQRSQAAGRPRFLSSGARIRAASATCTWRVRSAGCRASTPASSISATARRHSCKVRAPSMPTTRRRSCKWSAMPMKASAPGSRGARRWPAATPSLALVGAGSRSRAVSAIHRSSVCWAWRWMRSTRKAAGLTIRGAAAANPDAVPAEVAALAARWQEIETAAKRDRTPRRLWHAGGLLGRLLRDAAPGTACIAIDDHAVHERAKALAADEAPDLAPAISYEGGAAVAVTPLFERHDCAGRLQAALEPEVVLPRRRSTHDRGNPARSPRSMSTPVKPSPPPPQRQLKRRAARSSCAT